MKPRNKFEKAILDESKNLRPITKTQCKWAFRECIDHFAYRLPKGRITCMDCGHSWTMEKTTDTCICPHCGARLQVKETFERKLKQKQYFTVLTTCGEYQVLRMFLLSSEMEKGCKAQHYTFEIGQYWWLLVVAVTNSPKHDFNRCKSTTCKFLSRDTKSARDKNGTKPRKNKVKNTSLEISLVEYLCFVCKGTNLSLEKRGEIPISLIHNSFSYHCTPNVVIANGFDLKRLGLRKLGVKFCFALCWTFSKTRTGNRTKDLPPLLSNPWFGECLNDRHLTMLNFK